MPDDGLSDGLFERASEGERGRDEYQRSGPSISRFRHHQRQIAKGPAAHNDESLEASCSWHWRYTGSSRGSKE